MAYFNTQVNPINAPGAAALIQQTGINPYAALGDQLNKIDERNKIEQARLDKLAQQDIQNQRADATLDLSKLASDRAQTQLDVQQADRTKASQTQAALLNPQQYIKDVTTQEQAMKDLNRAYATGGQEAGDKALADYSSKYDLQGSLAGDVNLGTIKTQADTLDKEQQGKQAQSRLNQLVLAASQANTPEKQQILLGELDKLDSSLSGLIDSSKVVNAFPKTKDTTYETRYMLDGKGNYTPVTVDKSSPYTPGMVSKDQYKTETKATTKDSKSSTKAKYDLFSDKTFTQDLIDKYGSADGDDAVKTYKKVQTALGLSNDQLRSLDALSTGTSWLFDKELSTTKLGEALDNSGASLYEVDKQGKESVVKASDALTKIINDEAYVVTQNINGRPKQVLIYGKRPEENTDDVIKPDNNVSNNVVSLTEQERRSQALNNYMNPNTKYGSGDSRLDALINR